MRVYYCAAKQDLILRSPPKAGVSKDGHEGTATKCDSPRARGRRRNGPYVAAVVTPPSTTMVWPVMKVEASEAR
ncbi:hypothetical protein M2192_007124 [Bradyrhizobium elkanii USDA 61]|jgi:hypothetical protein|uniref:Uncharacterized protein n=1 Tax=Bradyrhizobium elkanii TaxID=29448 RepID=A0A8I1Y713_BRAEL|nr:hypothetical protein [Bradyrhizobium elkanii]MCS4010164.1 hypothetical protein [Bradyrhizobium elkanii USDA 61]MCP1926446.1 hypothetical protein [Bradyrhizobium elkanii]MCS3476029.1 hypothetical protein [Bradyrhizobium elkanii]MCS3582878.1 hypothetical protein [Bradyrhizobium elkanii]